MEPPLVRPRRRHREVARLDDPAHLVRLPRVAHADPPRHTGSRVPAYPYVTARVHAVVDQTRGGQPGRRHLDRPALHVTGRIQPPGGVHVEVAVRGGPEVGAAVEYHAQVVRGVREHQFPAIQPAHLAVRLVRAEPLVDLPEPVEHRTGSQPQLVRRRVVGEVEADGRSHDLFDPVHPSHATARGGRSRDAG